MKVTYFEDTDMLYVAFLDSDIAKSQDLDEDTVLNFDGEGNVCAINFEHASQRADVHRLTELLRHKDFKVDAHTTHRL